MMLVHTGRTRFSSTVNAEWVEQLRSRTAFPRLTELPGWTYEYREGLRTLDWPRVMESLRGFKRIRTGLVPSYMAGAEALAARASEVGAEAFPLGAGGGGSCLVVSGDPRRLDGLRAELPGDLSEIPFRLLDRGHHFEHC